MDRALSILRRRPRPRAAFPVCGASGGRRACCAIADEAGLTVKKDLEAWRKSCSSNLIRRHTTLLSAPHASAGASPRPIRPAPPHDGCLIHAENLTGKLLPLHAPSVLFGASYRNNGGFLADGGEKQKRRWGKERLRDSTRRVGRVGVSRRVTDDTFSPTSAPSLWAICCRARCDERHAPRVGPARI